MVFGSTIHVGNAPCSWGVLEFELPENQRGAETVLQEMAEAGYSGTELGDWGFLPTDPTALEMLLCRFRLTLVGAFVPVAFADPGALAAGTEAALRTARLVSAVNPRGVLLLADENGTVPQRTLHAGRITPDMALSSSRWDAYALAVESVARAVIRHTGVPVVFHHHCAGYVETPDEVAALLSRTSPELVNLCLDTGHWTFGGGDAREAMEQFAPRIRHLHFKDHCPETAARSRREGWDYFASVRGGIFPELGRGNVDFPGVLGRIHERLAPKERPSRTPGSVPQRNNIFSATARWETEEPGLWIVVEQDVLPGMGTPRDSARKNREYLRSLGL